jgi:hypothetical protein
MEAILESDGFRPEDGLRDEGPDSKTLMLRPDQPAPSRYASSEALDESWRGTKEGRLCSVALTKPLALCAPRTSVQSDNRARASIAPP